MKVGEIGAPEFNGESYCCVHVPPGRFVLQVTSNLANHEVAKMYADSIEGSGGHVLGIMTAKELADFARPIDFLCPGCNKIWAKPGRYTLCCSPECRQKYRAKG